MRIGDLAKKAAVTPRTIRYYESLGLIPVGDREGAGQHHYPEETVLRLRKIDQLKLLGLSLDEIHEIIDLYFTDPTGVRAKKKILAVLSAHLVEVDQKVEAMQEVRADLQAHIRRFERGLVETKRP